MGRSRKLRRLGAAIFTLALAGAGPAWAAADDAVRINEIQLIGSHNSYHAGLTPGMAKLLQDKAPALFDGLDYQHPDLAAQLSGGVRQVELDIYADTAGGRYAHPKGPLLVAAAGLPADPDPDPKGLMAKPGFKVMHVQDIDYVSNCQPFTACLKTIRDWSKAHPKHAPLFILIETKQDTPKAPIPLTTPEPFTPATFDALDAEIRSVFAPGEMIVPDQVRGRYPTLEAAVKAKQWPTLAAARGKLLFLMDQRPVGPAYLDGHPSLRGRVIFTNAQPGEPDAAFIEQNDDAPEAIDALVRSGYLVRTRTDADTKQARSNDTSRRDAVTASGAQILSTDYPPAEPAKWPGGYSVGLPGGHTVRCNPVLHPARCSDAGLEPKS
jgi:Phosphoinositide phospholipase C, Ca2+-dependent